LPADTTASDSFRWFVDLATRIGSNMPSWGDTVVDRVVSEICSGVQEIDIDASLRKALSAMAQEALESMVQIGRQGYWSDPELAVEGVAFARTLARRGAGLSALLDIYRVGQAYLWRIVMQQAATEIEDPDVRLRVLQAGWEDLSRWVDSILSSLSRVYEAERERLMRGAMARRHEVIRRLLDGKHVDMERASRTIAYDLRGKHVAVVLWTPHEADAPNSQRHLEQLAVDLAHHAGTEKPLLWAASERELWAWMHTDRALDWLHAIPTSTWDGARCAAGRPRSGTAGFRHSHREALAAQRIAQDTSTQSAVITTYPEVELVSIASQDSLAMYGLIREELADIIGGTHAERLRTTALIYLRSDCNTALAAERLHVHENTVRYRLKQIEQITGRPPTAGRVSFHVALLLAEAFGTSPAASATDDDQE
jgi:DNA-binding PucR family transcriptional regulator